MPNVLEGGERAGQVFLPLLFYLGAAMYQDRKPGFVGRIRKALEEEYYRQKQPIGFELRGKQPMAEPITTVYSSTTRSNRPARPEMKIFKRQKLQILELCDKVMSQELPHTERFQAFLALRTWVRGFHGTNKHTWDLGRAYELLAKSEPINQDDLWRFMKDIRKDFEVEEAKAEEPKGEDSAAAEVKALPAAADAKQETTEADEMLPFGYPTGYCGGEGCD